MRVLLRHVHGLQRSTYFYPTHYQLDPTAYLAPAGTPTPHPHNAELPFLTSCQPFLCPLFAAVALFTLTLPLVYIEDFNATRFALKWYTGADYVA